MIDVLVRCFYCGENADTIDHVVPRSVLRTLALIGEARITAELVHRNRVMEVDCCRDCNSRLSATYSANLEERRDLLKKRLRQKYRNLLEMPDWEDRELASMGRGLLEYVLVRGQKRDKIRRRLAYFGPATCHGVRVRATRHDAQGGFLQESLRPAPERPSEGAVAPHRPPFYPNGGN